MGETRRKGRLDICLVSRGIVESLSRAQALIMAGKVYVNGQRATDKSLQISETARISVSDLTAYVSRGGVKLEGALKAFQIGVEGKVCLDVGASTGGFTDCLLRKGAKLVYALDVGKGQLDWKLRNNPNVVAMEGNNIRYFTKPLNPVPQIATIDVSFISLEKVLPKVKELVRAGGEIIALIKPQFEAPRGCAKKGVVRDGKIREETVDKIKNFARDLELKVQAVTASPVKGPKGNVEYFIHMRKEDKNRI